jgi:fatty acid desaturase
MPEFLPYAEARKLRPPPDWWAPKIDRELFRNLQKRNNYRAFISHGLYFLLMAAVGWLCAFLYSQGSAWCILTFFVYGELFGMCNSRLHESLHGTPFKTGFLNEIVYWIASTMEIRCPLTTRWSHFNHHSYTILTDMDLEIQAPRPVKMWKVLIEFFYLYSTIFSLVPTLVLQSLGIPSKDARHVVPENEMRKVFWSSRFVLVVHLAVIALAIVLKSWLPILLFTLPRLYGGSLIWALILAQHSGLAEDVLDHRLTTRTIHLNPILSWLYMHMEYHTEHHIYPNIPFHSLAKFRKAVDAQMPPAYPSLWKTYREEWPVLWRQRKEKDFFIKVKLPTP